MLKKDSRFIVFILLLTMIIPLFFPDSTFALAAFEGQTADGFGYVIPFSGEFCSIVNYDGEGGDITIPSRIRNAPVTHISSNVFLKNQKITSVTIPNGVMSIGNSAFSGCTNLEKVNLPSSLSFIGEYAFSGSSKLSEINIPDDLNFVGSLAFEGTKWQENYEDEFIIKDNKILIYLGQSLNPNVTIPDGITSIGNSAFGNRSDITSIKLPNSLTSIEDSGFSNCVNLSTMVIPDSVTKIANSAFANNKNLVIYGSAGSTAEEYAKANNILFSTKKAPIAPKPITINVNNKPISFDQEPILQEGRTLVPVRAISDALGAKTSWNAKAKKVTVEKAGIICTMHLGDKKYVVNGESKIMDVAAQTIGGRILVPARVIAEIFGADVQWDAENRNITIALDTSPSPLTPILNMGGSTSGNLANGGFIAQQGDWLYYKAMDNGRYSLNKMKIDGSNKKKLINGDIFNINIFGDWIYFNSGYNSRRPDASGLFGKVKTDGTNLEMVGPTAVVTYRALNAVDDWIYYIEDLSGNKIMKMKTDDSSFKEIFRSPNVRIQHMTIVEDWIYFSYEAGGTYVTYNKMKLDGSDKPQVITKDYYISPNFIVDGDWLYYSSYSSKDKLSTISKIKTDGSSNLKIFTNDYIRSFNVVGDTIYYITNDTLCKIKTDGSGKQVLDKGGYDSLDSIHIIGNWIYCYDFANPHLRHRIKIDGTGKQNL